MPMAAVSQGRLAAAGDVRGDVSRNGDLRKAPAVRHIFGRRNGYHCKRLIVGDGTLTDRSNPVVACQGEQLEQR
jgi:hypothetical protein